MNCTNCNVTLEDVLTPRSLSAKKLALRKNPNYSVFCSRSCSTSYNNVHKKTGKSKSGIKKQCKTEGCENCIPKHGKQFCVECRAKKDASLFYLKDPTKKEMTYSLKSSPYSYIRWHARTIVAKQRTKQCQLCGYSKHAELAHIKGISNFTDDSKLSEINNPSNLIFLCPNCHWEYDRGMIELNMVSGEGIEPPLEE